MQETNIERMKAARETAQRIIALCDSYERTPNQVTLNHFLASVEKLADLAEDIEVSQTLKALDG
jgi:hypothetical protein